MNKIFYSLKDKIIHSADILKQWVSNDTNVYIVKNEQGIIEAITEENVIAKK